MGYCVLPCAVHLTKAEEFDTFGLRTPLLLSGVVFVLPLLHSFDVRMEQASCAVAAIFASFNRLLLALLDLYFLQPGARMNEANGPSIFHTLAARSFVLCPLWLTFQNLLSRFVAFSLWLLHFCRTINTTRGYGEQWVNMGMLGIFSYSAYDVTVTSNIWYKACFIQIYNR